MNEKRDNRKRNEATILKMAKLIAWGVIEAIAFIARHPGMVVAFLIAIVILKLLRAVSLSIINN